MRVHVTGWACRLSLVSLLALGASTFLCACDVFSGQVELPDAPKSCGDGKCEPGQHETCSSCPADCACADASLAGADASGAFCGDGTCDPGETSPSCPTDCAGADGGLDPAPDAGANPPDAGEAPSGVIYFKSTFSQPQPPGFDLNVPFPREEPCGYLPEKGLWGWVDAVDYGANLYLVPDPADPSRSALKATFDVPNYSDLKHGKLYELQNRDPSEKGTKPNYNVEPYLSTKEAYYRFKVWWPANTEVSSWRLLFQICGQEEDYNASDEPQLSISIEGSDLNAIIFHHFWADGSNHRWKLSSVQDLPKDRWVSFVVYYQQGSAFRVPDGSLVIWMDGAKVLDRNDVPTGTSSGKPFVIWGIGTYGDADNPLGQYQLFKDVSVSSSFDLE